MCDLSNLTTEIIDLSGFESSHLEGSLMYWPPLQFSSQEKSSFEVPVSFSVRHLLWMRERNILRNEGSIYSLNIKL